MNRAELNAFIVAVLGKDFAGPFYIDTELAFFLSGVSVSMSFGVNIWVYAKGGLCFLAGLFSDGNEIFQFSFGFYIEVSDTSGKGFGYFFVGFSDTGIDDF